MQKFEVIILPLAEKDIEESVNYIFYEKQNPDIAFALLVGLYNSIEKLSVMPQQHELDEDRELAALQIRKCYYKNYKVFFYVSKQKQCVYILRVLHMLRNSKKHITMSLPYIMGRDENMT